MPSCPRASLALKGIRPQFYKDRFPFSNFPPPKDLASTPLVSTPLSHQYLINYEWELF